MNLYHTVRARWKLVAAAFLAGGGLLLVVSEALPKQYSSRVRFLVPPESYTLWVSSEGVEWERQQLHLSQLAMVQSPRILANVIRRLRLEQVYAQREGRPGMSTLAALEILSANLEVSRDPRTGIITATVLDRDRDIAAKIANQIPMVIRDLRDQSRRKKELQGLASLRDQLRLQELEVALSQARIDAMGVTIEIPAAVEE